MRNLFLAFLLLSGTSAYAEIATVSVCGIHRVSTEGRHYLSVRDARVLTPGVYELFATNQFSANLLSSLSQNLAYCVVAGVNPARAQEGLSLISIR